MLVRDAEIFLVVADELHFGRAAERLFMAQPHVSRAVRRLEEELGSALFHRTTRQVTLTQEGEAFIEPARQLVDTQVQAYRAVQAASFRVSGVLKTAFTGLSAQAVVARLVGRLQSERPGVSVELRNQLFSQALMQNILNEEVDLGFGRWESTSAGIETQALLKETLVVAVPTTHRLSGVPGVWMRDLADDSFIVYPRSSGAVVNHRLEVLARAADIVPRISLIAPDVHTALSMVAVGAGLVLTLSTVAQSIRGTDVAFVPLLDKTAPTYLSVAWRTNSGSVPAVRAALKILREEFQLTS